MFSPVRALILGPALDHVLFRSCCNGLLNWAVAPAVVCSRTSGYTTTSCSYEATAGIQNPPVPRIRTVESKEAALIPAHEIEEGLPHLEATIRRKVGSNYSYRLRKGYFIPGQLSSLPGNASLPLMFGVKEAAKLVRTFGRNGIQCQVLRIDIKDIRGRPIASCRVLPKAVHISSTRQDLENLVLMYCPQDRRVNVNVPIQMWNSEVSPGVKKGGWLHVVNRTVALSCPATSIPSRIELDMRTMDMNQLIRFSDLQLPPGCSLTVVDPSQPVVRCSARAGGD